ncbi:adenylate cyclase [Malassezia vespertilionis]|uniref:adenylate cyclase n=1 Tax=Malassezia vespertilionis TaxID=2020962 RepID=UPI0024B07958|nr:adenylate cyclase [Malassezia vespertilionis]WFD07301.1 adenylate cyclase [Malassezia vespertilionis]
MGETELDAKPPDPENGVIEQKVAQTKREDATLHSFIAPWQQPSTPSHERRSTAAERVHTSPHAPSDADAPKHRPRNPLQLFRSSSTKSESGEQKRSRFRAPRSGHGLTDSLTRTRNRIWSKTQKSFSPSLSNSTPDSNPALHDTHRSSLTESPAVTAERGSALGIQLDTDLKYIDDIVDRNKSSNPRTPFENVSPTHSLSTTRPPSLANYSPRIAPESNVVFSAHSASPRTRSITYLNTETPECSSRHGSLEYVRRPSTISQQTSGSDRSESLARVAVPLHATQGWNPAYLRTEPSMTSNTLQSMATSASSSWTAPDSWAVQSQADTFAPLRNIGAEYTDDDVNTTSISPPPPPLSVNLARENQRSSVQTSLVIVYEPVSAAEPPRTDTPPAAEAESHKRRLFHGRRGHSHFKLDALFAPDLATHMPRSRTSTHDIDAHASDTSEDTFSPSNQHSVGISAKNAAALNGAAAVGRTVLSKGIRLNNIYHPHLSFRRFRHRSHGDSVSTRADSLEEEAPVQMRGSIWQVQRQSSAGLASGADEVSVTNIPALWDLPEHMDENLQPKQFLRIYRQDDSFLTIACSMESTTNEIVPVLLQQAGLSEAKGYGLFWYEKGADRPLAPTERPARILRRRLVQAGYSQMDRLNELGREDMSHIARFVFRPDRAPTLPLTGSQEEAFKHLNLQSMHLTMIPVFVYQYARWIVSLDLSRNPLTDLPVDFVQRCTRLRMLCLSTLALKWIPESVAHFPTLTHLDVSTNRVHDLSNVNLDRLNELAVVRMLNNRLSSLPTYMVYMHALRHVNLSNNRFDQFPSILCEMRNLEDLDLSFNTITFIPHEIANLTKLRRLVLMGNSLAPLPESMMRLCELHTVDVRNCNLSFFGSLSTLPKLVVLLASNNNITTVDTHVTSTLENLMLAHNPLSRADFTATSVARLTQLDLSFANLSVLDENLFRSLPSLTHLILDHNQFTSLPPLDHLGALEYLSCAANALNQLPEGVGKLSLLQCLNVQNNNLRCLPQSIWDCGSLYKLNASSNLLDTLPIPPQPILPQPIAQKESNARSMPLRYSLVVLRLADNLLTDDVFPLLALFGELEVLNLSMNEIFEVPSGALANLAELRELFLSGNKLNALPAEDLERMQRLETLFVNGNRIRSLPVELGRLKQLHSLDVGNNVLKYNIANWHYEWNWNANPELRYLNLSGNQRFEIRPKMFEVDGQEKNMANFHRTRHLRLLGLMEVTMTHQPLPDENDHRRVRTTFSSINRMPYGIADNLGKSLTLRIFDIVVPQYRGSSYEAMYGFFEGIDPTDRTCGHIARYISEHAAATLATELQRLGLPLGAKDASPCFAEETIPTALRRAFLRLNQEYSEHVLNMDTVRRPEHMQDPTTAHTGSQELFWGWPATSNNANKRNWHACCTAILVYMRGHTMYIANVGDALGVLSRADASVCLLGTKHEPLSREETKRIRDAEGWVSLRGYVNDELHVGRAFGHFEMTPIMSACPTVQHIQLTDSDEFVILANNELWRFVSFQMAVDIARMDREQPRLASQKLRDIALGYGASENLLVMVVAVGALFHKHLATDHTHIRDSQFFSKTSGLRTRMITDSTLARLEREIMPPIGHIALVFTDIKNSTLLWETNPGMHTAIRLHNELLRRQMRSNGGYEAKTEGDSFVVSFQSVAAALLWCFNVQLRLLTIDWPQEILDSYEGKPVYDDDGTLIHRGLRVRMGIHFGTPVCEVDPVNNRMDYFGPMVNRTARISSAADGGQIFASRDVVNELEKLLAMYDEPERIEKDHSGHGDDLLEQQTSRDLVFLRRMGFEIIATGEHRLKGIEIPEHISLVYPTTLRARFTNLPDVYPKVSATQMYVPTKELLELDQVKQLEMLCLRLEALSDGTCFPGIIPQDLQEQTSSGEIQTQAPTARNLIVEQCLARYPELLIIATREEATDAELIHVLAQLVTRINNSISTLLLGSSQSSPTSQPAELASP